MKRTVMIFTALICSIIIIVAINLHVDDRIVEVNDIRVGQKSDEIKNELDGIEPKANDSSFHVISLPRSNSFILSYILR